jgi:hypothetical protein
LLKVVVVMVVVHHCPLVLLLLQVPCLLFGSSFLCFLLGLNNAGTNL